MNPPNDQHVEIPAEGLLLATQQRARQEGYVDLAALAQKDPDRADELREEVEALLQAAAPSIRAQERERLEAELEDERCESCEDTGVYTEGLEWAPCGECFRGNEFALLLKAHAKEVRQQAAQQERERVKEALKSGEVEQRCEEALDVLGVVPGNAPLDGVVEAVLDAVLEALTTLDKETD